MVKVKGQKKILVVKIEKMEYFVFVEEPVNTGAFYILLANAV